MSREEANAVLQAERDSGVFLVRDSTTIKGDFVLCVKLVYFLMIYLLLVNELNRLLLKHEN